MVAMKQPRCLGLALLLFVVVSSFPVTGIAHAARLGLVGQEGPMVIDGSKQRSIEITGIVEGGPFTDVRLHAEWAAARKTDTSPPLVLDKTNFRYTFPLGGMNTCGLVSFFATGILSGVKFNSEKSYKYIDCDAPRILIGKPSEGQMVKAKSTVAVEVRLEDDILAAVGYSNGLLGYVLEFDLDGQPVGSPNLYANSPVLQRHQVTIPNEGRHAIRVRLSDLTKKSAEKTIWVNADGTVPQVKILSPTANQNVLLPAGGLPVLTVEVEAVDTGSIVSGVDRVEFYLDGVGVASSQRPSGPNRYSGSFGVAQQGQKRITVKAFDKVGNAAEASVSVNVLFEGTVKPLGQIPKDKPSHPLPR